MIGVNGILAGLVALVATVGGHRQETDCFAHPARCGYPSAATTGVPPGTRLKTTGSITIRKDGAVLSGRRVDGTVIVAASNVTIRDSLVSPPGGGAGTSAIQLLQGADGFRIEDSEVGGRRRRNGLQSAVWNHYGNPGATAVRSYFHRCSDCWEGPGRFAHDYMVVDASYPGSHDEDIYVCGAAVRVEQSTLINRHGQTATVFGDTAGCGGNRFIVTDNLLAGGGYVLYPQANSESPTGYMKVTGNRFARCEGRSQKTSDGGSDCAGGPSPSGIFPAGGHYGVAAYYYLGAAGVWSGNYWDDNLKPICLEGHC